MLCLMWLATLGFAAQPAAGWVDLGLYPFSPTTFSAPDGHTMSVVDTGGTGPAVLFVHGTPTWSFMYRDVIAALGDDCRCIAPDHLGYGLSDKPPGADYRPAAHAERLIALVDALDLQDVTLVIHDVGGPLGLALLAARPERFSALVVINSFGWSTADDPSAQRISRVVAGPVGRWLYLQRNASPQKLLPAGFADRGALSDDEHLHYTAPFPDPDSRHGPWQAGVNLGAAADWYGSVWEQRGAWEALPAEIVWGMADPWFGPEALARWEDALPDARVTRLPDVGHFVAEDAPGAVTDAIRRLLDAASATTVL